jgi:hypothetical protein
MFSTATKSKPPPASSFEALADRQITAPRKARARAAKNRQQALRERDQQVAAWRGWRRQGIDALLAGPYGSEAHDLIEFLRTLTFESGPELVKRCGPWVAADPDTRFLVVSLINTAIAALREKHNLAPFDDALPGEPPTVFQIIRECLA